MKKIVICGNYGATNIGDEAILAGILKSIHEIFPAERENPIAITVLSANPENTTALHGVKSVPLLPAGPRSFLKGLFSGTIFKTIDAIRTCDGFILGGGGLFNEEKPMSIIIWGLQAKFALLFGKPLFCAGQSVNELNNFFSRWMVRSLFSRCRAVSVRDKSSQKVLHGLGLPGPEVYADPAFVIHNAEPSGAERENILVLSLRQWHKGFPQDLVRSFTALISHAYDKYGLKTILVPFSSHPENDTSLLESIHANLEDKNSAEVFEFSNDFPKVIELFSKARFVAGMRLHSLIFAALTGTPFLAIPYSRKVDDLVTTLEMERYSLPLRDVSEKSLIEKFDTLAGEHDSAADIVMENNLICRDSARRHGNLLKLFIDSV
jgi:polysaccharide pyruvyl transferase CsaB